MTRRRKKRPSRVIGAGLIVISVVAVMTLVATLVYTMFALMFAKPESPEEDPKDPVPTASEAMFLENNILGTLSPGTVTASETQQETIKKARELLSKKQNYHMTILEHETYGTDQILISSIPGRNEGKDLSQTQTRQIEVYSTYKEGDGQYYLIEVTEIGFVHASKFTVEPGIYFFRAGGNSPIYTINGQIPGEEKARVLELLEGYLLPNYCNIDNFTMRMGDLSVKEFYEEKGSLEAILENPNGLLEISATDNHLNRITATFDKPDDAESYKLEVAITYDETFDPDRVSLNRVNPYKQETTYDQIAYWTKSEDGLASFKQVSEANEIWQNLKNPEEFSATVNETMKLTVVTSEQKEIKNVATVQVKKQKVDQEVYTFVSIRQDRRAFGEMPLAAGQYIFNDEFIWTSYGKVAIADAPKMYQILSGFATQTYVDVKNHAASCGEVYLESFQANGDYQINLVEKNAKKANSPNYVRVLVDSEHQVENFQTAIRYYTEDKWKTLVDVEVIFGYQEEDYTFSVPEN